MTGDQAVNEFVDRWWKQPLREWENKPLPDFVIPGRPSDSGDLPSSGDPVTDRDFAEEAGRIRRRLNDGPPPRNPNGGGGGGGGGFEDEMGGIEACAYYISFRFGRRWGIYIGLDCWFKYAEYLFHNGVPADAAVDEAFYLLYRHEYFHFEVDKAIEVLERAVGISTGSKPDAWIKYHGTYNPSLLEEALANAFAHEHAGKRHKKFAKKIKDLIGTVLVRMGPGYRDFLDVSGRGVTGEARSQLMSEIMGIHRNDQRFVPGLQALIRPSSFAETTQAIPRVTYEGERLNVYFF